MKKLLRALPAVIGLVCDVSGLTLAADKIRISVTNFNMSFLPSGLAVKRVIKALIKANRHIRQNREGTIQTLVDWGRTTPALAATAYDSAFKAYNLDGNILDEGLLAVIDQAVKKPS